MYVYEAFKSNDWQMLGDASAPKMEEYFSLILKKLNAGVALCASGQSAPFFLSTTSGMIEQEAPKVVVFGEVHERNVGETQTILEILSELSKANRKITLYLENVDVTLQPLIDQYLAGRVGVGTLAKQMYEAAASGVNLGGIGLLESEILKFARERGFRVVAFDDKSIAMNELDNRDRIMTSKVLSGLKAEPDAVQVTFVGAKHNQTQKKYYKAALLAGTKVLYLTPVFTNDQKTSVTFRTSESDLVFTAKCEDKNRDEFEPPKLPHSGTNSKGEITTQWR